MVIKMSKYRSYISPAEEIYEHIGTSNDLIIYSLCGISNPDPQYEIMRKSAECYTIEYIISGEGVVQENDTIHKVSAGDFFILHPCSFHHYFSSPKNPWKKIWLYMTNGGYYMNTLLKLYNIENITLFPQVKSPLNLFDIFDIYKYEPSDFNQLLELKIHELVINLANHSTDNMTSQNDMELAKLYISNNITSQLTVNTVSEYIGMNHAHFSRKFKNYFHVSPVQYILQEKMTLAKHLLGSTDIPIPEIAEHLSFFDTAHFSNTFKRHCGYPPSEYRSQANNERKISQDAWHHKADNNNN